MGHPSAGGVFVVTGAGNGIGRAVASELLRRNASVAAVDLNEQALAVLAEESSAESRLTTHVVDITDAAAVAALPHEVVAIHGQVDGLFNIAGIVQHFETAAGISDRRIEQIFEVNFYGTVRMTRAFLPYLEARPQGGAVLITSSLAALVPVPGAATYGASKAAVALFGHGLRQDLRSSRSKVTVTTVLPGMIWTDIVRESARILGTPERVAKALAMPVHRAANRVIEVTLQGRGRVIIGKDAQFYDLLRRISPRIAERVYYLQMANLVYRHGNRSDRAS